MKVLEVHLPIYPTVPTLPLIGSLSFNSTANPRSEIRTWPKLTLQIEHFQLELMTLLVPLKRYTIFRNSTERIQKATNESLFQTTYTATRKFEKY